VRLLTPFKDAVAFWGQPPPVTPLPSPPHDLERDVPPLIRPQARASWQPLTADIGNPWYRVPQAQNLRLYEQLVETIPVLNAALTRIVQLVGTPHIEAEDDVKAELQEWMDNVVVNRIQTGFNNWFSTWCFDHLLYGRAHTEIILPKNRKDIYALQPLHTRTIELRPDPDLYSIQIVQILAMRGMWVELNKRLILTALHDVRGDLPQGNSLLFGLPFVGEIFTSMLKDHKRIWERFGTPSYHVAYKPPPDLADPTGSRSQNFLALIMNQWNQMMTNRANGDVQDYATAGDVTVSVIGAAGEALEFVKPLQEIIAQMIAKTGLPPFLLGMQWQTTESMSSVEGGLLSQMVAAIRGHMEPEMKYLFGLRQLLAGKSDKLKISWEAPTLIDLMETARAETFNAKATAQKIANGQDLWRLGVISNLDFARQHRPDLENSTDEEVMAACPLLLAQPPAPIAPGQGIGGEDLNPDTAGGGGAKSITYGRLLARNGNGRR
jgi:hypothetical protein